MISVNIGNDQRPFSEVDPHWIERQINGRRHDGLPVTVVVSIDVEDIHLRFVAPPPPGGRSRQYDAREVEVIELWKRCGMNSAQFSAGDLIEFLKRLPQLLR